MNSPLFSPLFSTPFLPSFSPPFLFRKNPIKSTNLVFFIDSQPEERKIVPLDRLPLKVNAVTH